jgi:PAS domain S-box-containing protein
MTSQIESLHGAILRVDPEGRICELNEATRNLDDRLTQGASLIEWLGPEHRAELVFCLTYQGRLPDTASEFEAAIGGRRYRLSVAGKAGEDSSRYVQVTDITEHRALSERIAVNEQRFRSLFTHNPDAVCCLDLEGQIIESNQCTEYLTGYTQAQLCNYQWSSLIDESDLESAKVSFEAAVRGNPCSYRCKVRNRNGRTSIVQVSYAPVVVHEQVVGVFGVIRDKTESYRLERSRRLLHACMARVHDVVLITETDQLDHPGPRIVYVNDGVERMIGYRPQEVLGKTPRIFQGPDTDRGALRRIRRALEADRPVKETLVNYRKNGEPFWNELEIVPIPMGPGRKSYFASVQRDITQSKEREAELQSSREELRRLSRAQEGMLEQERRRIARDLHDELGQTLTALKLKLGIAVEDMHELLPGNIRRLEEAIESVDGAVEKVREISSNLRPAMLDDLGFEAAAEWFLNKCAGRDGLDISWSSEPPGSSRVKGDVATALSRILQECMTNVSRHSNASAVTINYQETDDKAALEVRDNGSGFDPGRIRKSGLGLVGIRERIAMLRGALTVESAAGKGAHIRVELPLEAANND